MDSLHIESPAGSLSATLDQPADALAMLLFAHGAGADHRHAHMQALAQSFNQNRIATLRFNFPFKEAGRNRVDSQTVSIDAIVAACHKARELTPLPLLAGGHSFGGRMVTHAVAQEAIDCIGLILCSYPLHPAKKPGVERAAHLNEIAVPMLFLSGTRDALAERDLLQGEVDKLSGQNRLHWLDTADHSYKILKRSRVATQDVYAEAGEVAASFVTALM
jgi:predicted alpha/beta-hydrolase family hydrolase